MENTYKYLFPFEKIPQNSVILIYGAGILGQEYLKQIAITKYCKVLGFADKNYLEYQNSKIPVYAPEKIHELDFDFIVIALRSAVWLEELKRFLKEQGVSEEKIVCVFERALPAKQNLNKSDNDGLPKLSANFANISFALFMAGGIGDMITYKRLVEELFKLMPSAYMDIFTAHGLDFLKWIYKDDNYIKNILPDLGYRYSNNKEKYSFALSFTGSGFLSVDYINENDFAEHGAFLKRIKKLSANTKSEGFNFNVPPAAIWRRRILNGDNCYTSLNYTDVFDIKDIQIKIPEIFDNKEELLKLKIKNYITVNSGNGLGNNAIVVKSWPIQYFNQTINMFKEKYPDIKVIQIGAKDESIIESADEHFLGKDFEFVAKILKNSIFHFDIEGGLVHLASQLQTKCVVLFGPTQLEYFGYKNNINIRVGTCRDCFGLCLEIYKCVRNLKEPECMYNITPEIAFSYIDEYMKNLKIE